MAYGLGQITNRYHIYSVMLHIYIHIKTNTHTQQTTNTDNIYIQEVYNIGDM